MKKTQQQAQYYEERLRAYMKSAGLRCTQERIQLLRAITSCPPLFTIEDLETQVSITENITISRPTYYNNLHLFQAAGLVVSYRAEGKTMYQLSGSELDVKCVTVCTRCQSVKSVTAKHVVEAIRHLNTRGFMVQTPVVYLNGLCASCKRKKKTTK